MKKRFFGKEAKNIDIFNLLKPKRKESEKKTSKTITIYTARLSSSDKVILPEYYNSRFIREVNLLVDKFLEYHKLDPSRNSSLDMLVYAKKDEPVLLQAIMEYGTRSFRVTASNNVPDATIKRLFKENRVYPNFELPM